MKTVTLEVRSRQDSLKDSAAKSRRALGAARISFASAELLWQVLTAKRWEILKAMRGAGALSIREVARRVHRDVEVAHADVHALLEAGVLSRTSEARIAFPYMRRSMSISC